MYKVTWIFNSPSAGWSESWFLDVADVNEVKKRVRTMATVRAALCGSNVRIEGVRITDIAKPRAVAPFMFGDIAGTNAERSDLPASAILAFVSSEDKYRRNVFLRGVPDSWIKLDDATGKVHFDSPIWTAFKPWVALLKKDNWRFQATIRIFNDLIGDPILSIQSAQGLIVLEVPTMAAFQGDMIRVFGIKGPKGSNTRALNRRHLIQAKEGDLFAIAVPAASVPNYAILSGGQVLAYPQTFPPVDYGDVVRPMRKKVGRRFFEERGRQRNRQ